jgi:hypothetical protein
MARKVLMKCGCVVYQYAEGPLHPFCSRHQTYEQWDRTEPDLTGRKAVCLECGSRARLSNYNLYQFCYRPEQDTDEYWCLSCAFGDEQDDYDRQEDHLGAYRGDD